MAQLLLKGPKAENAYLIRKKLTTVGSDLIHDVVIPCTPTGIAFTITQDAGGYDLLPGRVRLKINGETTGRKIRLQSCDRLEWAGGTAVFLDSSLPADIGTSAAMSPDSALRSLNVLQNLASTLQTAGAPGGVEVALNQALDALVDIADAEEGYLLSEMGADSAWKLVATNKNENAPAPQSRKELFSNTILKEALDKRAPVYVENIIGHQYAEAASVIEAKLFSVACFPLSIGDRVFGAVFLFTRSPGRSIRKERLPELRVVATQAALMLASSVEIGRMRKENAELRALVPASTSEFIYNRERAGSPMAEVERKIEKLGATPLNIVVLGETGTGKELAAKELHRRSSRAKGPFIAINCAAIPSSLLEATLFGYERGAFTGAVRAQAGKFSQADGGTLFLDEIGDLPLELQAKLLRVLQEKTVEPLGSSRPQPIDVRVISATHKNLDLLVRSGHFRQDLYFRLAGAIVSLPPLRTRKSDIAILASHFLRKSKLDKVFAPATVELLENHPWPGNVRELEHVVTRAAMLSDADQIQPADIEMLSIQLPENENDSFWGDFESLDDAQLAFTRNYVEKCLTKFSGNRSQAAKRLGISERTLYRILAERSAGDSPGSVT